MTRWWPKRVVWTLLLAFSGGDRRRQGFTSGFTTIFGFAGSHLSQIHRTAACKTSGRWRKGAFRFYQLTASIPSQGFGDLHAPNGEPVAVRGNPDEREPDWDVYVDLSKSSIEKGASATLDAFIGLVPLDGTVRVQPCLLPKTKLKGPVVRCIRKKKSSTTALQRGGKFMDVASVDSVDKVFRILTRHMNVANVSMKACECLKWKYKANGHLEAGKVNLAIDAYDKALATHVALQEGPILLMRAAAYMRRAASHKAVLKDIVTDLAGMVPESTKLQTLYEEAAVHPTLSLSIFRKVLEDTGLQEKQFRKTQYRHGLYQYALLQACQDALRATELLPSYAAAWLRAGEILSELWKLQDSTQYYERAMELDTTLQAELTPVISKLRKRQELLDNARAFGWTEDALRLALDVAGG